MLQLYPDRDVADAADFQGDVHQRPIEEHGTYLAQALRGSVSGARADLVVAERIDLDVTRYDKRLPSQPVDEADAFLQFSYEIEVFTDEPFDRELSLPTCRPYSPRSTSSAPATSRHLGGLHVDATTDRPRGSIAAAAWPP
jgi:hypothetical protein